jgi:hypothetical protein
LKLDTQRDDGKGGEEARKTSETKRGREEGDGSEAAAHVSVNRWKDLNTP